MLCEGVRWNQNSHFEGAENSCMDEQFEKNEKLLQISSSLTVKVRPLAAEDFDELIELFNHLGPDSRYNRFHTPLTMPSDDFIQQWARILADVPPEAGEAWLIFADLPDEPDAIIGGGRYVFIGEAGSKTAEVSLAVRDDMQKRGIGSKMLQFIAREALENGVETLAASVLTSNPGAIAIVERLSYPSVFRRSGPEFEVEIDLTADTPIKK